SSVTWPIEKFVHWMGLAPPTRFWVRRRAGYVRPAIWDRSAMVIRIFIMDHALSMLCSSRSGRSCMHGRRAAKTIHRDVALVLLDIAHGGRDHAPRSENRGVPHLLRCRTHVLREHESRPAEVQVGNGAYG